MKSLNVDFSPKFSKRMGLFSKRGITGTFMSVGGSLGMAAGEKKQMFYKGKGMMFDGYREYTSRDDARMIDWKASLRANKKLVKKFSEEKNKNIVFFFDVSSSMSYSSHTKLKCEYAAELIASLAYSFVQTGDSVGLVMFADGIKLTRNVSVGESHWFTLCNDLKNPENYEGQFSFTKSAKELFGLLKMDAVIFVVSDFIGLEDESDWHGIFEIMSARFELVNLVVRDPFDNYLPKGLGNVVLSNPFNGKMSIVDVDSIRDEYNDYSSRFINMIKDFSERLGTDFLMLTTDKPFVMPMINFLRWREDVWK